MSRRRDPKGVPTGGEFAAEARREADITLPRAPVSVAELELTKSIAELAAQTQEKVGGELVDARLYALASAVRQSYPDVLRVTLTDRGDGGWVAERGVPADYTKPVTFERPMVLELPGPVSLSRDYTVPRSTYRTSPTLTVDLNDVPRNGPEQAFAERRYEHAVKGNVEAVAGAIEAEVADDFPDAREVVVSRRHLDSGRYMTQFETLLDGEGRDISTDPHLDADAWDRVVNHEFFQDEAFCDLDPITAERSGCMERRGSDFVIDLRAVESPRNAPVQDETLF